MTLPHSSSIDPTATVDALASSDVGSRATVLAVWKDEVVSAISAAVSDQSMHALGEIEGWAADVELAAWAHDLDDAERTLLTEIRRTIGEGRRALEPIAWVEQMTMLDFDVLDLLSTVGELTTLQLSQHMLFPDVDLLDRLADGGMILKRWSMSSEIWRISPRGTSAMNHIVREVDRVYADEKAEFRKNEEDTFAGEVSAFLKKAILPRDLPGDDVRTYVPLRILMPLCALFTWRRLTVAPSLSTLWCTVEVPAEQEYAARYVTAEVVAHLVGSPRFRSAELQRDAFGKFLSAIAVFDLDELAGTELDPAVGRLHGLASEILEDHEGVDGAFRTPVA